MIEYKEIPFGSEAYEDSVVLRDMALRKPLGLAFDPKVLALEISDNHLCAYDEDKLVGVLIMTPKEAKKVKMRQFAVDPKHQRKGIGTGLVAYAEYWAKKMGYKHIELHARLSAVPFYLRLGYEVKGNEFQEVTIPHFAMEKNL
jgi:GNAT superfamily N-acetyltransferase